MFNASARALWGRTFGTYMQVDDDEAFLLDGLDTPGRCVLRCDATACKPGRCFRGALLSFCLLALTQHALSLEAQKLAARKADSLVPQTLHRIQLCRPCRGTVPKMTPTSDEIKIAGNTLRTRNASTKPGDHSTIFHVAILQ